MVAVVQIGSRILRSTSGATLTTFVSAARALAARPRIAGMASVPASAVPLFNTLRRLTAGVERLVVIASSLPDCGSDGPRLQKLRRVGEWKDALARHMAVGQAGQIRRPPIRRVDDQDLRGERLVDGAEMRFGAQHDDREIGSAHAELGEAVLVDCRMRGARGKCRVAIGDGDDGEAATRR